MLRQRNPFQLSDEDAPSQDPIMDEQEQEELVQSIRKDNERSNTESARIIQGILSIFIFLTNHHGPP